MEHIEGRFEGMGGGGIYHQSWLPEKTVRAVLLVVHGLGEHGGRYAGLVENFLPMGCAVVAPDHVGHGRSAGQRAHVERFSDYTSALARCTALVRERHPQTPVFLVGHSMGGLIAACCLLDQPDDFTGAVLSAPAIRPAGKVSGATVWVGRMLSALVPRAGLLKLDAAAVSRDPGVVEAYLADPLVHKGRISVRLAVEMMKAMDRVTAEAGRIRLPLLILQGTADRLVDPSGARMLYERVASVDKTLKTYEGLYHEVFNEPERGIVLGDVAGWLAARI